MTMHDEWTDQLSDYLDGELQAAEHAAVEAHLRGCPLCSAVLNDLNRVVARAGSVEARIPEADLWTGIAGRMGDARQAAVSPFPREGRRVAFTWPQLAAAAALVAAVSGGLVWRFAAPPGSPQGLRYESTPAEKSHVAQAFRPAQGSGADTASSNRNDSAVLPVGLADAQYDAAVADLEQALKKGRGRLDPSTIAIVEQNLQIIDRAIEQAREALAADPANSYLSGHLVETRRRKLDLLRRATALTTEMN